MDARWFRSIVSGERRGVAAAMTRGLLRCAESPYALAVRYRNRRYDRGAAASFAAGVPVVSVGNLTLGGTGKTPMVEWIARWLREHGVKVAVISRGYGAQEGARNDEALELEQKLPGVPHLQNPDRVAAAAVAVADHGCGAIVLDDGFQHRRIRRDLDIVLLDALAPFGYGHVFPRGMLREPATGLARADIVCLSRADLVDAARRRAIRDEARRLAPSGDWIEAVHRPIGLVSADASDEVAAGTLAVKKVAAFVPLESLAGRRIAAFCGIGNPEGFRRLLREQGYDLAGFREFPDHHPFTRDDLASLADWAAAVGAAALFCTQKDLVKIDTPRLGAAPLYAVQIALNITDGREHLERRLAEAAEFRSP